MRVSYQTYGIMETMSKKFINIGKVLLGTFLLAISVEVFIIPYDILSGGVAGIAVALEPFFHINETLFANLLVVGFLFLGWIFLGKVFIMDSILSSLSYPIFTTLVSLMHIQVNIPAAVASLYAGLFGGLGIGIVMSAGGSTGGVDIPTMILAKALHVKVHLMVMVVDGLTVLMGILAYDLSAALIGLLSVFVSSYAIGRVLSIGQDASKSVQIISDDWETITDKIFKELDRGTTILEAMGGYQHDPRKIVLCVVSQKEYSTLIDIVHSIDSKAFIITTDASDMHGEGFTWPSSSSRM